MTTKTTSRSRTEAQPAATPHSDSHESAVHIGLDREQRSGVATLLGQLLADQHVLYQKTRMCHWNLIGGRFDSLHKLFEAQYEALAEAIDQTAERIRMLDQVAPAAMEELLDAARLEEVRGLLVTGQQALKMLLADHETTIRVLREDIAACTDKHEDVGSADFLTSMLRDHEKTAWMLRSHLEA